MTRLRSHTKSAHKVTITEYKAMYGPDLFPIKTVYHRCGICEELVVLDSDHIATHLKKPGHNITHKNYNEGFMVDTRNKGISSRLSHVGCSYQGAPDILPKHDFPSIPSLPPKTRDKRAFKPV